MISEPSTPRDASPLLRPGLRVVVVGTRGRTHAPDRWYAGPGNRFWELLHAAGLTPELLGPDDVDALPAHGIGLTDLILTRVQAAGQEPDVLIDLARLHREVVHADPVVVAFVSKTAASWYARGAGERQPKGYGAPSWAVAGRPAFVLPGPSGANNGMPLPLRAALWTDLNDFLAELEDAGQ